MHKIVKSYLNENCIACTLGLPLYLGRVSASLISVNCQHCNKTLSGSKFKKSPVYFHLNVFMIFLILTMLLLFIIDTFNMDVRGRLFVKSLVEIFTYFGAIIVLICTNINTEIRVKELNGLASIIEQKGQYGIDMLHIDDISKILSMFAIRYVLFVIGQIIYITSYFTIELKWSEFLIATVSEVCFYSQMIFTFNAVALCHVYMALFNRCFFKIKSILGKNFTDDSVAQYVKGIENFRIDDKDLLHSIQKMRKLQANLYLNFRLSSQFISPQFVCWSLVGILLLTANYFFYLTVLIEDASLTYLEFIYHTKTVGGLLTLSLYIRTYQNVTDVSEDILSYLFRYPISKLNQAEAAEVEMMLSSLHIQKPVLKASDMFTVGTKLAASISATVVTYVLVALQFRASWTK